MNGNRTPPGQMTGRCVAFGLRRVALGADSAVVLAMIVGREDAAVCTGVLSTTLRFAAELLEGPSQR